MRKLIVVDAGHGGQDSGAVSASGIRESDINLNVAMHLAGLLSLAGLGILATRSDDTFESLTQRCRLANDAGADLLVSIHANSYTTEAPEGFEVYTSRGLTDADRCATLIWTELRAALPGRRARMDSTDDDPDFEAGYNVLVGTRMPAVLVELGFLSNPEEAEIIETAGFLNVATAAVAAGIVKFFDGGLK